MAHRTWLQFIFVFLSAKQGLFESQHIFAASFSTGALSCKNFRNNKFDASNVILSPKDKENEGGAGVMCLTGSVELHMNIDETVMLSVVTEEETVAGFEPMLTSVMSVCHCIADKGAHWAPIFKSMGIESCPVKKGRYNVTNMCLDFDFMNAMLSQENVRDYRITSKLTSPPLGDISCYEMSMSIYER